MFPHTFSTVESAKKTILACLYYIPYVEKLACYDLTVSPSCSSVKLIKTRIA